MADLEIGFQSYILREGDCSQNNELYSKFKTKSVFTELIKIEVYKMEILAETELEQKLTGTTTP